MQPMKSKRGWMASWCNGEKVFVWGGVYHEETVLKKCEMYDIKTNTWKSIKSMHLKRKDSSCVSMNTESMYVFGGSLPDENTFDTIERYDVIENSWEILEVKLPYFMTNQVALRLSGRTILIAGGNLLGKDGYVRRTSKVYRLFIETNFLQEETPLSKPALSVYPCFVHNSNLMIIDEDSKLEQPSIVEYSIARFLVKVPIEEESAE